MKSAIDGWAGRYAGQTVACLASGPSLTAEDAEKVRHLPTFVTNSTFRLAPWGDVLVGYDGRWWQKHGREAREVFHGKRVTCSRMGRLEAECLADSPWLVSFRNSGAVAIALALHAGASRVLLLGFDCQFSGGRKHWHPDHGPGLSNCASIQDWPRCFKAVAHYAKGRGEVVNCSRETALTVFPRMSLEEALS